MNFLKQSTAATLRLGPFVDETDAKTPETGLTIAQADVRLSKAGGAFAQKSDTGSATHDENGFYAVPVNTTDTGTVGRLRAFVLKSGALPVWQDYFILPAAIYDWLTGGAAPLTPTVAGRTLDVTATGAAGIDWGNVENPTTTVNLSGTTVSTSQAVASVSGSVGSVTAAVTLPTMPTDWITAAGVKADAVTKIQAGLSTYAGGDTSGTTTLLSRLTSTRAGNLDNLDATVSSRLATSGYTAPPTAAQNATQVRTELATELGRIDVAVSSRLATAGYTAPTTPPTVAAIADAVWDEAQSGHVAAGTFGAYLDASVSGVSTGGVSAADIADAVWDEALSGHATAGTAGAAMGGAATATALSSVASDVTDIGNAVDTEVAAILSAVQPAAIRTAIGLAAADLDTQLDAIKASADAAGSGTPAYTSTLATVTSTGGTLNSPPSYSLAGYTLTVGGRSYDVATHTAGQAAFTLVENWKVNPTAGDDVTAEYLGSPAVQRAALLASTVTMRRLDTVTAPTVADGLAAAAALAAGDMTRSGTSLTLKHLDGTTAAAKTLDDADNPTARD